ncbi:enoyl-[acyl-carrier protein] reductase II [Nocardia tenerifensis]|uniref:Enoyl-[acyl-carrier protein] reductase II n=1 Tax=Nocardia tenerifensis TaxID=228006 RepID=A0A318K2A3_9NOCA|nr:nitronate monooxygenase [Nocardia tenerifensis]PXX54875.1 enoyl-[acyl-carrier protein] reductase II [Nocardia tenerifensis]
MSVLSTRLTEKFAIRYPFACAGMAFAGGTADLAVAVTAEGGIGAVGAALLPAEELRRLIHEVRQRVGSAPFNINLISYFDTAEQVHLCAQERVPIVSFHWGHPPADQLAQLRSAGVSMWEQVGSAEAAGRAIDDGVDVVVAQGWEAGGHNYGGLPTMVGLPAVVDAVGGRVPVLAAGGITDGRQVAAALCLGADGVWVGTRLVASAEAQVHLEHHRRLVAARGEDTVRSSVFGPEWPQFNPMRVQRDRVVAEWDDRLEEIPADRDALEQVGTTVFQGEKTVLRKFNALPPTPATVADWEEMPWLMGQGVGLIREVKPAGQIVRDMMDQAERVLTGFGKDTERIAGTSDFG